MDNVEDWVIECLSQYGINGKIHFEPVADNWGASIQRFSVDEHYFILKRGNPNAPHASAEREVRFYREIAPLLAETNLLVECYGAYHLPDSGQYWLILADRSLTHFTHAELCPPSWEHTQHAIEALAKYHAWGWEKTPFDSLPTRATLRSHLHARDEIYELEQVIEQFLGENAEMLNPRQIQHYERLAQAYPPQDFAQKLASGRHVTLTHGDMWYGNLLFSKTEPATLPLIIDWANWATHSPMRDLPYLIDLVATPEYRAQHQRQLLEMYHQHLIAYGVQNYAWVECWQDYQIGQDMLALLPVWLWHDGQAVWRKILP